MSEREADMLLRKDLNKFIGIFNDLKPMDALLLGVLSYNIGPGAVNNTSVIFESLLTAPRSQVFNPLKI